MASASPSSSSTSDIEYYCSGRGGVGVLGELLVVWTEWKITILVVATLCLEVGLVAAGSARKRSLNRGLQLGVWLSYLALDTAAAYALGLMLSSGCGDALSLWAPLVLLHVGTPDAVNAFAPADNELWRRSAFKLALELLAAAVVVHRSARFPPPSPTATCIPPAYLPSAVLLCLVGAFKCAEHVWALRCGSASYILASARPIYKYMGLHPSRLPLPVRQDARRFSDSPSTHSSSSIDTSFDPWPLLVAGEHGWYRHYTKIVHKSDDHKQQTTLTKAKKIQNKHESLEESFLRTSMVYYHDIKRCQELHNVLPSIVDISLAYALYKIYRRRLSNLAIHQKDEDHKKVRDLMSPIMLHENGPQRTLRIIDLELSFIFDGVFSKAAAGRWYQGIGLGTRMLSLVVLMVALLELVVVDASSRGEAECRSRLDLVGAYGDVKVITYVLMVVAMAVEGWQVYKLMRSNWVRVWLAVTYVRESKRKGHAMGQVRVRVKDGDDARQVRARDGDNGKDEHQYNGSKDELIGDDESMGVPLWARRLRVGLHGCNMRASLALLGYTGSPASTHWRYRIGQRSLIVDALSSTSLYYLVHLFDLRTVRLTRQARTSCNSLRCRSARDFHLLQDYIIKKLFTPASTSFDWLKRASAGRSKREARIARWAPIGDAEGLEEAVLFCHVATCICELRSMSWFLNGGSNTESKHNGELHDAWAAIWLSRYCLHLLLDRPKLMPEDPEVAASLYTRLREQYLVYSIRQTLEQSPYKPFFKDSHTSDGVKAKALLKIILERLLPNNNPPNDPQIHDKIHKVQSFLSTILKPNDSTPTNASAMTSCNWEKLATTWVEILVYIATSENATPHIEQMAKGGELITMFWVLLEHAGVGRDHHMQ